MKIDMTNGVIITTAIRKDVCTETLKRVLEHTPHPRMIILIHYPGQPQLDSDWPEELAKANPEVYFIKMKPGGTGGLTAAWNEGFKSARAGLCDAIVCMNDDVYVNETWPAIFNSIRNHPRVAVFGPVSNNPGVDYTQAQKKPWSFDKQWIFTKEQPAGSHGKNYFCLNGFCFGLSGSVVDDLRETYGGVLDDKNFPWGGQEEDLGRRIEKMGGELVVEGRTWVKHLKHSDWRVLGLKNQGWLLHHP